MIVTQNTLYLNITSHLVVSNMYENLLEEAGLTRNETLVYLTLLKLGKSKSGTIVKEANISGGKIYETLYKLADKGLVKIVEENNVKHFIANEPETILDYIKDKEKKLKEKEIQLKEVLPELKNLIKQKEDLESVSLVKGIKGISALMDKYLKEEKEVFVMGVTSKKKVDFNNFWIRWHRKRVLLKKKCKIIFSDKDTDYWRHFKKQKYTKVKEILSFTPTAINIMGDNVFINSYDEEFKVIHISSKSVANSFKTFFNQLWGLAKP